MISLGWEGAEVMKASKFAAGHKAFTVNRGEEGVRVFDICSPFATWAENVTNAVSEVSFFMRRNIKDCRL